MGETKYIFVTGGVASSLGKGIISSSIGKLLQARGYNVTIQKFDPYINIDPGTLNPYEHGECYVTDDGAETDLDLGHYERFLNVPTSQANNVTTGRIYLSVIEKERRGEFLGNSVDSFESRALAPHSEGAEIHYYQLVEDYEFTTGKAAPWFGSEGGAQQYVVYKPDGSKYTIKELEETGIIEDVTELVNKGEIVIE